MATSEITFSFGENWKQYLSGASERQFAAALEDIQEWLGRASIEGRTVVDVGSGSGIHSLAFHTLGARELLSFDYDVHSVEATRSTWERAGKPASWKVMQGSVLDRDFLKTLGRFEIVYSWGVLHHTGSMWQAIENAFSLVEPGGRVWISLYKKGPRYEKHLALKRRYNAASAFGQRMLIWKMIVKNMLVRIRDRQNPFTWNRMKERGMSPYYDIIDWLGGRPYEVATEDETLRFARERGLVLERIMAAGEGGCSTYVFSVPS